MKFKILGAKYPKSKKFLMKTVQQIELVGEMSYLLMIKILLQLVMLPKCIVSYCAYFISDSGRDSFQLPYPFW